ncbi:hypothetical protein B0H66DRAFT_631891 [Apodospora peruviana]|uniref:Low temperature requirement A n=1 Tax=Apodospora peruviana TaxID=516989 RepID=A0AAE0LZU8_9PEZI|nr:hypothetical protein B0H66DRAFT_631891 [Apodospora peruviana]
MGETKPESEGELLTPFGRRRAVDTAHGVVDRESEALRRENSEPHNLMLLYDLFFAANMTAFSNIHDTTTVDRLVAYVGYFTVLWFLWLNVMLFDVRFVVDSISERSLRAIHLGAMVGVSVIAPQYSPAEEVKETFQHLSIILLVSRLTLAAQYGLTIYQWKGSFKNRGVGYFTKQAFGRDTSRTGLVITCATHVAVAIIYLGISFYFSNSKNSLVRVTWYVVGFVEACVNFGVSYWFDDLGFKDKALQDRMKTATLLILGEGVIVVTEHVSTIGNNANSWTSQTIGVLTATVALIYVIFQIYFDWSWPVDKIKGLVGFHQQPQRQQLDHPPSYEEQTRSTKISAYIWNLVHFPFHLVLVLIMEGATQFVLWWKIVELIDYVSTEFLSAFQLSQSDSSSLVHHLNATINHIWERYPRDLLVSHFHREALLETLSDFNDTQLHNFFDISSHGTSSPDKQFQTFTSTFNALKLTTLNSILRNYNIDDISDAGWRDSPQSYEQHAFDEAAERFELVYIYVFVCAGMALVLMALLHVLSRPRRRLIRTGGTPTKKERVTGPVVTGIVLALGVGLTLLASMARYEAHERFMTTPWIIPSVCIVLFFALVVIHGGRWILTAVVTNILRLKYMYQFNRPNDILKSFEVMIWTNVHAAVTIPLHRPDVGNYAAGYQPWSWV